MEIKEFEKVKIKTSGIIGTVVDIHVTDGEQIFIVESQDKGVPGGYGPAEDWKLFDCLENEIEKI